MAEVLLSANDSCVETAQAFAARLLDEHGIAGPTGYQMQVIIDEVVSNIVNYSGLSEDDTFTMSLEVLDDPPRLHVQFRDGGIPFDPLALDDPDMSPEGLLEREGGLGVYMVKQMTDEAAYAYEDGSNVLTLIKELR